MSAVMLGCETTQHARDPTGGGSGALAAHEWVAPSLNVDDTGRRAAGLVEPVEQRSLLDVVRSATSVLTVRVRQRIELLRATLLTWPLRQEVGELWQSSRSVAREVLDVTIANMFQSAPARVGPPDLTFSSDDVALPAAATAGTDREPDSAGVFSEERWMSWAGLGFLACVLMIPAMCARLASISLRRTRARGSRRALSPDWPHVPPPV